MSLIQCPVLLADRALRTILSVPSSLWSCGRRGSALGAASLLRTNSQETIRFPLSGENRAGNHSSGRHAENHFGGHRIGARKERNAALRPGALRPQEAFSRIPAPRRGCGRSIHPPRRYPVPDRRAAPSPAARAHRNRYRLICEGPLKRSPLKEPLLTVLFSSACSLRQKGRAGRIPNRISLVSIELRWTA